MKGSTAMAVSKSYTKDTADEFGALKGANCQVSNVDYDADGNTILTLLWENTAGKQIETDAKILRGPEGKKGADGKDGSDGKGIKEVKFNEKNQLIVVFDDDTESKPIDMPATEIEISKATGNVAEVKADGLYVGATGVEISKDTDNAIETKVDGLYVKKTSDVEISKKSDNTLKNEDDGLYVPETDLTSYAKSEDVVDIQQTVADKGKFLGIGNDGKVTPTDVPTPDLSDYAKSDYEIAVAGTDLNNLKTTGRHFFIHNRTYSNLPTNVVNGWLDVKVSKGASSVVKQVFYRQGTNNTNDFEIYVRSFSTSWSDWVRLATTKDLGTKHTISYTNTSGQTKSITVYGS